MIRYGERFVDEDLEAMMRNADLDRLRISKPIQSLVQVQTPKCLIATMTKQYVRLVSTLKKGKQVLNE